MGGIALLGRRGAAEGFDDGVVGKFKQDLFNRPRVCFREFPIGLNLLGYSNQEIFDVV